MYSELQNQNIYDFFLVSADMPITNTFIRDNKLHQYSRIRLPMSFNGDIGILPKSIVSIIFNYDYNHPLDNLPFHIEEIYLDKTRFNKSLDLLPPSLKILHLGSGFEQNLDNLPLQLKELKIPYYRHLPLDNLPNSIETLIFKNSFDVILNKVPANLRVIKCSENTSIRFGKKVTRNQMQKINIIEQKNFG